MKRTIIVIALLTVLFLPAVSIAQVDYSTLTAEQRIVLIRETESKLRELINLLIALLQEQIKSISTQDASPVKDTKTVDTSIQNQTTQNMPKEEKTITLEIFSPMKETGLGRKYKVSPTYPEIENESNYIDIGLVIWDKKGQASKKNVVTITATDEQDPIERNGTGTVGPIYINEIKKIVPYYPYHYEFKTSGKHTITLSAEGQSVSVDIDVE